MNKKSDKIDFSRTIYEMKQRWYYYLIAFVFIMGFVAFYMYKKNADYLFHANILIEQEDGGGAAAGGMAQMMRTFSLGSIGGGSVDDEILVMQSHSLFCEMISELKLNRTYREEIAMKNYSLYKKSPVVLLAPDELFDTLQQGFQMSVKLRPDGLADVKATKGLLKTTLFEKSGVTLPLTMNIPSRGIYVLEKTADYVEGEERNLKISVAGNSQIAEDFARELVVDYSSKNSNGITLEIEDNDLQRGKDILNKLIELYNNRRTNEKNLKTSNELKFIDERLASLTGQLHDAEKKVEDFKTSNNVTDIEVEARVLLEQTSANKQSIVQIQTQLAVFDMICKFLDDPANRYSMIPITSGVEYEGAAKSIEAYNNLVVKRMELNMSAKKDNASLMLLNAQIDGMRSGVVETIEKARASTEIAYNDFVKEDGKFASRLKNLPTHEREYLNLMRDQTIKNNLYVFLLEQRETSVLKLGSNYPMGRVVDAAYHDVKPVAPKWSVMGGLGLLATLLLPTFWFVYKGARIKRLVIRNDVENAVGVPVWAEVCSLLQKDVDFKADESNAAEFRALRNELLAGSDTVCYVASMAKGHSEFVVSNLGRLLALTGKRTVVVDINCSHSENLLETQGGKGVVDFINDETTTVTSVVRTSGLNDKLFIVPKGQNCEYPVEALLSDRFDVLVKELKSMYDFVLINGLPISKDLPLTTVPDSMGTLVGVVDSYCLTSTCKSAFGITGETERKIVAILCV